MVNFIKTKQFILYNKSGTTFNVAIDMSIEGEMEECEHKKLLSFFMVDFKEGIIPAKSRKEINVTFNPRDICDFKLKLFARLKTNDKSRVNELNQYECTKAISTLIVKSNYPLLKIIDIKNNEMSLASLWEKFEISKINQELSKSLSDFEKQHILNTRLLFDESKDKNAIFRKFMWNFGYIHGNNKKNRGREI